MYAEGAFVSVFWQYEHAMSIHAIHLCVCMCVCVCVHGCSDHKRTLRTRAPEHAVAYASEI